MRKLFARFGFAIYDILNFLGKLTLAKITNFLLVFATYYFSRLTGKPRMAGFPISASIEPTTSCNLRCPQCISGLRSFTRPTGMMETGFFSRITGELKNVLINMTLYFQGEPFLNPDFFSMVKKADENGIYTMTSTNGHYLSEENALKVVNSGLARLIISVDSFDQEIYSGYRIGGNIETVINGIDNLVRIRRERKARRPFIILQFLIYRDNEKNLADLRREALKMGADKVVFKTMQIYDYRNGSDYLPENRKFSRYKKTRIDKYVIKSRLFNHCWKMWHSCVITWDGRVIPCCFDKNAEHVMGTANGRLIADIWQSSEYQAFRSRIFRERKGIDICTNCSEGTKVWL